MSNRGTDLGGLDQPSSKYTRTSSDARTIQVPSSATTASHDRGYSTESHAIGEIPERFEIRTLVEFDNSLDRWAEYLERIQEFSDLFSKRLLSGDSVDRWICDPLFTMKGMLAELVLICRTLRSSPRKCGERLLQNTHCHGQYIIRAAVAVDRKWADVLSILKKEASGTPEFQVRVLEDFRSSVEHLNDRLGEWLQAPLIAPDSERVNEILETVTDLSTGALHFVNRFESAKTLFLIQLESYIRRSPLRSDAGPQMIFPFMDSLFGMGKTTFARNYLALVTRISNDLITGVVEYPQSFVKGLVSELARARTLHITFRPGSLFDSTDRMKTFSECIVEKMRDTWGVVFPHDASKLKLGELLKLIPKPVFLVLDEIGVAFSSSREKNRASERESFYDFVSDVCTVLTRTDGMHYILCGRAEFMWDVGVRPEADFQATNRVSPGRFQRINLNPIRERKIEEILHNTVWCNQTLSARLLNQYPSNDLSDMIKMLYVKTAGHPRSLLECLKSENPLSEKYDATFLINEVKVAVRKFPTAIRQMMSQRDQVIDLTEIIDPAGCRVTGEFIATRIHAGFGDNLKKTQIYITPVVEEYLIFKFCPLSEFLVSYEELLDLRHVSRTDLFEECIAKWFQSAFANRDQTCGQIMGDFCPQNSILSNISWELKTTRMVEGKRILRKDYSISDSTISVAGFSKKLCKYLTNGKCDMYLPAPLSASPDLFVIPGLTSGKKIIIGVQAKCYANQGTRITKNTVLKELGKFHNILSKVRNQYPDSIGGVLIMFATCLYTECDFGQLHHGAKSFVWESDETREREIEVLVLNQSTANLRRDLFGIGLDLSLRDRGAQIVERIIEYSSRKTDVNFKDVSPRSSSSSDV